MSGKSRRTRKGTSPYGAAWQYEMACRIEAAQERTLDIANRWIETRFRIQLRRGTHGHRVEVAS